MGRGRGDGVPPLFSTGGTRPPLPHFFGLKFVQKLAHCCNWLLTETQCKNFSTTELVFHVTVNLCLSLVSGVPPTSFLGLHPWPASSAHHTHLLMRTVRDGARRRQTPLTTTPRRQHRIVSFCRGLLLFIIGWLGS